MLANIHAIRKQMHKIGSPNGIGLQLVNYRYMERRRLVGEGSYGLEGWLGLR